MIFYCKFFEINFFVDLRVILEVVEKFVNYVGFVNLVFIWCVCVFFVWVIELGGFYFSLKIKV